MIDERRTTWHARYGAKLLKPDGLTIKLGAAVVLCGISAAACASGEDAPPPADVAPISAATAFPATPADGPMPEIPPAPDDYTPTAANSPSTDIWVGSLQRGGEGLSVEGLANATQRSGYDNQPSFESDDAIIFVSAIDAVQTEVMRYNVGGDPREPVTHTSDVSEFSPMLIPGQAAFSAIHEIRGLQYLWRYSADGAEIGPIFATAEPVGYHAWADETVVAMFILGQPATLQVGNAATGEIRVIAERPGRSIHRIPGTTDISFVRKVSDDEWWIEQLNPVSGETERLVQTLPGREDYAWTPEGEILMGDGSVLYGWTADDGWVELQDLAPAGVDGITRLAVSPGGGRIAIVGNGS